MANMIPVQFNRLNRSLKKIKAAIALNKTMPILFIGMIIELEPGYCFNTLMIHQIEK